ncbi:hypothetical protein N9524_01375 [Flavobacteriaceae bacterium]|nr:hypothetical protein [Flavobacteriaceae bacterium]MDB4108088.1 hypothetical protein [Flavobacteriaceae bacterium]
MVIKIKYKKPEIVLFLAFLCLINFSLAQSYSGVIQVSDSIIFPYYLKLPTKATNGYSVSDMHGSTETLSLISLKDSGNGIINVEESLAIYTRTNSDDYDDFCKLFFDLKKKDIGSKSMEFDFEAKFNNNTQCAVGLISLEETTNLKNKLDNVKNKIANNKLLKSLSDPSDRDISVQKIESLQKFSPDNFIDKIELKHEDSIGFLCLSEKQSIRLNFNRPIEEVERHLKFVTNARILKSSNIITFERMDSTQKMVVGITALDSADSINFKLNTIENLELQFFIDLKAADFISLAF